MCCNIPRKSFWKQGSERVFAALENEAGVLRNHVLLCVEPSVSGGCDKAPVTCKGNRTVLMLEETNEAHSTFNNVQPPDLKVQALWAVKEVVVTVGW